MSFSQKQRYLLPITTDRRGRGLRSPLIPPHLPGYRSRRENFDQLVVQAASLIRLAVEETRDIEFAVEEIVPSDPSPWEPPEAVLGRLFPPDRGANLPARMVFYRLPIQMRCSGLSQLKAALMQVMVQNIADYLQISPQEIMNRLFEHGYR